MAGLQVERVAEVIVRTAPGGGRRESRGSGYLVRTRTVLTAAHLVAGADVTEVRVRFNVDRPGERVCTTTVAFVHAGLDIAVLTFDDADGGVMPVTPVAYGRIGERDREVECTAVGFPRLKVRAEEDGKYRDTKHLFATAAALSNRREGTLELRERNTGMVADPDAWNGMSGAAVFSGGYLVGVVREHRPPEGAGALVGVRVDSWAERLLRDGKVDELALLGRLLGTSLAVDRLPDIDGPVPGSAIAGMRAVLRDLTPARLADREAELADLASFCIGPEQYRWVQGPPWAGKTTLAAWFALHPPQGVVPVCFFVTGRQAGRDRSAAFTDQLIRQLTEIAGHEPGFAEPADPDQERQRLLERAAEAVGRDGGVLLLVVDGLDEDRSRTRPPEENPSGRPPASIAALLPNNPPANVRVLVTSRPSPGVPTDVRSGHPLHSCTVTQLRESRAVAEFRENAEFELGEALRGNPTAPDREIVGFIAAARGVLTAADLSVLTGRHHDVVQARLRSSFARILRVQGEQAGDEEVRGYLFAHDTLSVAAKDGIGPDLAGFRERIRAWAEDYRAGGWPQDTPWYLLASYGLVLADEGDQEHAAALATDPRLHDRLRARVGNDAVTLANIEAVRSRALGQEAPDLRVLAELAAAAGAVERRNRTLPTELAVVWARIGKPQRAEGLARSVVNRLSRAVALVDVAEVFAVGAEHERAFALVQEALALVASWGQDWEVPGTYAGELRARAAVVLAVLGHATEAVEVAESAKDVYADLDYYDYLKSPDGSWPLHRYAVCALAAVAATLAPVEPALAAEALARAQHAAEQLTAFADRIDALAAVAGAQQQFDAVRAARSLERVEVEAASGLGGPRPAAGQLARAALALYESLPETAIRLARAAAEEFQAADVTERSWSDISNLLAALAATGLAEEAEEVCAGEHGGPDRRGTAALAVAWLRAGQPRIAYQRAREIEAPWKIAEFVSAAADSRPLDEVEHWIDGLHDARSRVEGLTALAAEAARTDPDRASRLARTAADASALTESSDSPRLDGPPRTRLAEALAACGEFRDAERLARSIGGRYERDWALAAVAVHRLRSAGAGERERADHLVGELSTQLAAPNRVSDVDGAAVEAMAHLDSPGWRESLEQGGARLPLAAAVKVTRWDLDGLIELAERQASPRPQSRIVGYLRVIAALSDCHEAKVARLFTHLLTMHLAEDFGAGDADQLEPEAHYVLLLLLWPGDPESAARLLQLVEDRLVVFNLDSVVTLAMVRIVLGERDGLDDILGRLHQPGQRSAVRSAVAMLLARVHGPVLRTPPEQRDQDWPAIARSCAELAMPVAEPTPGQLARARRLLADALQGDGWYHALPAVARLAPEAVLGARDVLFDHLGWER